MIPLRSFAMKCPSSLPRGIPVVAQSSVDSAAPVPHRPRSSAQREQTAAAPGQHPQPPGQRSGGRGPHTGGGSAPPALTSDHGHQHHRSGLCDLHSLADHPGKREATDFTSVSLK